MFFFLIISRIEDDHEIARNLEQVNISGNNEKCVIS